MRFLCLVFAVLLLVSLAAPGYGLVLKYCPKIGYCSNTCSKTQIWATSHGCKMYCCLPASWKWK
ncbi:ovodefensin subfamily A, member 3 precursor [Gallus gallus]|uniref:Gallin protein n=1 Tax=Gallus gallus TaxID=9031 RepID=D5GR58_CHICK|nr:ovodefensin subfamily A, member 3 precursor [Gallus gallus]CBE70278.1 Gallin protein precursor [Gallus gallus]CBE70279.1 Gallin protein precursor [Gallus gallus]CBE70281.1 Gallin protein precursor [Gallus gallus]CBE70282.1 Gallin protein precursor [Gallus gallus]CBE70283.1 Gallin protein precursor [Gallus gallus]|eukprot:NP_001304269.1 Ovodefensin A2 precursor [Gallus gallus]